MAIQKPFIRKISFPYAVDTFRIRALSLFFGPLKGEERKIESFELASLMTFINHKANPETKLEPSPLSESDDPEIIAMAKRITSGAKNDIEAAKLIFQWITMNFKYEIVNGYAAFSPTSALDVLHARKGVCAGFSNLYVAMLRAVGIPSYRVEGRAEGRDQAVKSWETNKPQGILCSDGYWDHAWTKIFLAGRWYYSDVTWGQQITIYAGNVEKVSTNWDYFTSSPVESPILGQVIPIAKAGPAAVWKSHLPKAGVCVNQ